MFKRIGTVIAAAVVGLLLTAGVAAAAPIYAPPGLSAVAINANQILVTGTSYGDESGPDESVTVSISYGAPSGLRSSAALSAAAAAQTFTAYPDGNGNFSAVLDRLQSGDVWVRAVGDQSGDDVTAFLAAAAVSSGYAGGDVSSGYAGLAATGASIGGPLAIGLGALLAGLTLLFFGTRGVMQRKRAKSVSTS